MIEKITRFSYSQSYAKFILENNLLDELTQIHYESIKKNHPTILDFFTATSEDEKYQIVKNGLNTFLHDLAAEKVVQGLADSLERFKNNQLNMIMDVERIHPQDIIMGYTLRKQSLIEIVHKFSDNPSSIVAINLELDAFLLIMQKMVYTLCTSPTDRFSLNKQ